MTELKMEHVLLFAVVAFLMYNFIGGCNCNRGNGFSVGSPCDCNITSLDKDPVCIVWQSHHYDGDLYGTYIPITECQSKKSEATCSIMADKLYPMSPPKALEYCKWTQPPPSQNDICFRDNKEDNSCNIDPKCSWCTSPSSPPACNSIENAKTLPHAIFACSKVKQPPSN